MALAVRAVGITKQILVQTAVKLSEIDKENMIIGIMGSSILVNRYIDKERRIGDDKA